LTSVVLKLVEELVDAAAQVSRRRVPADGRFNILAMAGKRRRATRGTGEREERGQDPRLVATQVSADAEGFRKGDWIVVVSPVNTPAGDRLMWHPPQPVAFNLLEAKRQRDPAVRQRRSIMGNLIARPHGIGRQPRNTHSALDCLSGLAAGVLFSFTAVESLANHAIEMLEDDTVVTVRKGRELPKAELITGLGIDEKFKRVVPILEQGQAIAGTATWDRYRALKFLRDELVHVKARGYDRDPDVLTAYDRLMIGEGDRCVEDAQAVVEGAFPGFLPQNVLDALA
jgi:hypothetical protein